jgi:hypothetical protein
MTPWQERRTGHIIVENGTVNPETPTWVAHWDADDAYPGYGWGDTQKQACDRLQELSAEWEANGRPPV